MECYFVVDIGCQDIVCYLVVDIGCQDIECYLVVDIGCFGIGFQDIDYIGFYMYSWFGYLDLLFGCKMVVLVNKIRY